MQKADPQNISHSSLMNILNNRACDLALTNRLPVQPYSQALPPLKQLVVVRRIAEMGQTSPEAIEEVERLLEMRHGDVHEPIVPKSWWCSCRRRDTQRFRPFDENAIFWNPWAAKTASWSKKSPLMFRLRRHSEAARQILSNCAQERRTSQWAMALKGLQARRCRTRS